MKKCDFSYRHYIATLKEFKKSHRFIDYQDISLDGVILRHDVDYSLERALEMAKIEKRLGIQSTFFILIHSIFYNPSSPITAKFIKKILDLDHKIGLHYDGTFFEINETNPNVGIIAEIKLFEKHFNTKINVISRHNPTLSKKIRFDKNQKVIDVDSSNFKKNVTYISDSVQNWREGCFCNHLTNSRLEVLIHPILWTKENEKRVKILRNFAKNENIAKTNDIEKIIKMQKKYLKQIKKFTKN